MCNLSDEPEPIHPGAGSPAVSPRSAAALSELYERHEQAMFRMGYMQGELDRMKALGD